MFSITSGLAHRPSFLTAGADRRQLLMWITLLFSCTSRDCRRLLWIIYHCHLQITMQRMEEQFFSFLKSTYYMKKLLNGWDKRGSKCWNYEFLWREVIGKKEATFLSIHSIPQQHYKQYQSIFGFVFYLQAIIAMFYYKLIRLLIMLFALGF